eukprot:4723716-Prymnesium_polylepis.1
MRLARVAGGGGARPLRAHAARAAVCARGGRQLRPAARHHLCPGAPPRRRARDAPYRDARTRRERRLSDCTGAHKLRAAAIAQAQLVGGASPASRAPRAAAVRWRCSRRVCDSRAAAAARPLD